VVVAGSKTSGEVEPVLVVAANGRRLLALGSDHTDRELEREDIAASKAACTKVVSTACVPLDAVSEEDWDLIALESRVDGGSAYQSGTLAELLRPGDLLERLGPELLGLQEGDVLFLGTVPTLEGIRSSSSFSASMSLAASGWKVELSYAVADMSSANRAPLRKPEIEFSAVEGFDWAKVEGIPGQLQRILASDPATAVATRMLRFEPGCDTSAFGVLRHDFWEEVYILSGELHDLSLDRVFGAGTYACRPPGMPHGPWRSEPGCVTFEVRYPAI